MLVIETDHEHGAEAAVVDWAVTVVVAVVFSELMMAIAMHMPVDLSATLQILRFLCGWLYVGQNLYDWNFIKIVQSRVSVENFL